MGKTMVTKSMQQLVLGLIFFLLAVSQAYACDSCQQTFEQQLRSGKAKTAHSEELLRLIKKADADKTASVLKAKLDTSAGVDQQVEPVRIPQGVVSTRNFKQALVSDGPVELLTEVHAKDAAAAKLPATGYVAPGTKPDKKLSIEMGEGEVSIGNGVMYKSFLINGQIPGPTLVVDEGDIVEFTVVNKGKIPHGVSIHSAYTQTSKHVGKIGAGETKSVLFRATYPGVYMYHCAPGGHAIPMHVLLGQYGMMLVKPKLMKYKMEEILGKKPDVEINLLQHELYASGRDAIAGQAKYQLFNGQMFRYIEQPIVANPGDYIRINFLNVGPNMISTFHIVGIIWDYVYWQGMPNPENTMQGGQSVLAGPTDSWTIDFRAPEDEGAYLMLNHAVGATSRGAIGILEVSKTKTRTAQVMADGPKKSAKEMEELKKKAVRVISPSEPSPDELANPWRPANNQTKVQVEIVGNSFYPKVIEIPAGTTVEWVNEDAFAYFEGEFSGIHNVVTISGPEVFASPMLAHAERFAHTFNKVGEFNYMCTPHPYMKGVVRVVDKAK